MSSEPEGSPILNKLKRRAYAVEEFGGLLWASLGDKGEVPVSDTPAFAPAENTPIAILKVRIPANCWQIHDGQVHNVHSSDMVPARVEGAIADAKSWFRPSSDKSTLMQTPTTSYSFHYVAIRRPIKSAATHDYLRITSS